MAEKKRASHEARTSALYWFGGFSLITLISFVLDLYSMAALGQSLVVPLLAGLEVAENNVLAPCVLHAHLQKKYDYSAAVIVVVGAVLTSIFGPQEGASTSSSTSFGGCGEAQLDAPSESEVYLESKAYFEGLFSAPLFVAYESTVCAIFLLSLFIMKFEPKWADGALFMAYGYTAGFLGGQQNLFLKGVGTMMTLAFGPAGSQVFADWMLYVFLLGMFILAPTQLAVINVGLLKFSVLKFVPAYTVLYIIHGTSVGLFFYQEYLQLDGPSWAGFSVGFVFIFGSLLLLSLKPPQTNDDHGASYIDHSEMEKNSRPPSRSPSIRVISKLKLTASRAKNKVRRASAFSIVLNGVHNGTYQPPELSSDSTSGKSATISSTLFKVRNLMTHGLSHKAHLENDEIAKINSSPEISRLDVESGDNSMTKSKSLKTMRRKARRVSSVMIAFGGGLMMSHNMASKDLKVGPDKMKKKHDILRKMTSRNKMKSSQSSMVDSKMIELSMEKSEPGRNDALSGTNFVIGQAVSTTMGRGIVAKPMREDKFVEVQLEWTLANRKKATMFVHSTNVTK